MNQKALVIYINIILEVNLGSFILQVNYGSKLRFFFSLKDSLMTVVNFES